MELERGQEKEGYRKGIKRDGVAGVGQKRGMEGARKGSRYEGEGARKGSRDEGGVIIIHLCVYSLKLNPREYFTRFSHESLS